MCWTLSKSQPQLTCERAERSPVRVSLEGGQPEHRNRSARAGRAWAGGIDPVETGTRGYELDIVASIYRLINPAAAAASMGNDVHLHVQWLMFQHVSEYSLRKTSGNTKD